MLAGSRWRWTGPNGWLPPTPTWPAGWGRGCWWRPWPGPEWSWPLGVVHDDQFGPLVMVAAGGVLVEVLGDRRFALPPVGHRQALAMLDRLAVRGLLDGVRGAPRSTGTRSPTPSSGSQPWPSTSATGW